MLPINQHAMVVKTYYIMLQGKGPALLQRSCTCFRRPTSSGQGLGRPDRAVQTLTSYTSRGEPTWCAWQSR